MYNTAPVHKDAPMIIYGRELTGACGPICVAHRCGPHGGKGRKRRGDIARRAISEQSYLLGIQY
jgi:hypothetical protein